MSWKRSLATAIVRREWIGRPVKSVVRSRLVTQLPVYQDWVLGQAANREAQLSTLKPWVLIETMLTCNTRCMMCAHSEKDMRGVMSMELYEKLIREAAEWGIETVSLSVYGEPFADPRWLERVQIAARYGVRYSVVTNGSILRDDVLEQMFALGNWEEIIFSVNGFSTDAYEAMMPPLKRDKVYGNIARFLQMREKLGVTKPRVQVSCVVTKLNAHERKDYERFWKSQPGVTGVMLADCGSWLGEMDLTDLTVGGSPRHVARQGWLAPCPSPWSQLSVMYDGTVVPCCEDHASRSLVVGDANKRSLKEIFYGQEMSRLRELHRTNKRCSHEICARCKLNPPWIT